MMAAGRGLSTLQSISRCSALARLLTDPLLRCAYGVLEHQAVYLNLSRAADQGAARNACGTPSATETPTPDQLPSEINTPERQR
jgi:hypothetical protein